MVKRNTKSGRRFLAVAVSLMGAALLCFGSPAMAHPVSGQLRGIFSDPVVLTGSTLDGATAAPTFFNNSATGFFSGIGTNVFNWGTGAFALNQSTLTFVGNTISGQASDQPFSLGTISYTNGTSDLTSLVFGVDLTLSVPGDGSVTPLTSHIKIVTSSNTGTTAQNADFVGFTSFAATFNVFESATAFANLNGRFVGDPMIQLDGFSLQPGQGVNGFIGAGGLPQAVSEPGSFALLGLGLAFGALLRRRSSA